MKRPAVADEFMFFCLDLLSLKWKNPAGDSYWEGGITQGVSV